MQWKNDYFGKEIKKYKKMGWFKLFDPINQAAEGSVSPMVCVLCDTHDRCVNCDATDWFCSKESGHWCTNNDSDWLK